MHEKSCLNSQFLGTELTDKNRLHIYCNGGCAYVVGKIAWIGGATTPSGERTPAS
ncbi:unnamed protein product, partial [Ectocarpus sp. 4 AP-2014]